MAHAVPLSGSGPAPWIQTNGPSGGIISTVEIDPDHPDILYAGGTGGGVFKTVDGGATWTMLEQVVSPSRQIHDLLVSPNDPRIVYALAGRLYQSTNSGQSWQLLDQDLWFSCVAMDSASPRVLIAGTWDGKVYHSANAGEDWTDVTADLPGDRIAAVAIGGSNEFWAGTANGSNGRLYHTTDGGASWNGMDIGQRAETDIHTIFIDPEDTTTVYVGLVDVHNESFDSQNDAYLLKTQDGGTHWEPLYLPSTDAMINVIGRAPADNTLYIGTGGTVYKSGDGGQNWTWIGPPGRNGDMYDIAVDPRDSDVLCRHLQEHRRRPELAREQRRLDQRRRLFPGLLP